MIRVRHPDGRLVEIGPHQWDGPDGTGWSRNDALAAGCVVVEGEDATCLLPLPALDAIRKQQLADLGIHTGNDLAEALRHRLPDLLALPRVGRKTVNAWAESLGVELAP